jgi:hypothetical protein
MEQDLVKDVMNDRIHSAQVRAEILKQAKGVKYWLVLLGF